MLGGLVRPRNPNRLSSRKVAQRVRVLSQRWDILVERGMPAHHSARAQGIHDELATLFDILVRRGDAEVNSVACRWNNNGGPCHVCGLQDQ